MSSPTRAPASGVPGTNCERAPITELGLEWPLLIAAETTNTDTAAAAAHPARIRVEALMSNKAKVAWPYALLSPLRWP